MSRLSPALSLTMRCMSAKSSTDLPSIANDDVARLKSGGRGGAVRLHRVDARAHRLLAVDHEDRGKNDDGQDEIRQRPGHHDGRALAHRLKEEAFGAFAIVHGFEPRRFRNACGILVAEEFHIAAERNGRDLPAGAVPIVKAAEFGTKTDGKHQNPHAAQARDHEVPELVEKHHDAEHEEEGKR